METFQESLQDDEHLVWFQKRNSHSQSQRGGCSSLEDVDELALKRSMMPKSLIE